MEKKSKNLNFEYKIRVNIKSNGELKNTKKNKQNLISSKKFEWESNGFNGAKNYEENEENFEGIK